MIKRWYIRPSAKSKGYFTGWKHKWFYKSCIIAPIPVDPSFTKSKFAVKYYTTKKEALKKIEEYKQAILQEMDMYINNNMGTAELLSNDFENNYRIQLYDARIEYLNTKLFVYKEPIEYKYNNKNNCKITWNVRTAEGMAYRGCNLCGYSVHNIPEFIIQFNRRGIVRICAICMSKIADETKIQKAKIPKSIIQHYKEEQFLNLV